MHYIGSQYPIDRDYRDGVWRCETLRLQRNRVQGSARTFLIDFAGELSWMLKDVMRIQSIGLHNVGGVMHHVCLLTFAHCDMY